MADTALELIDRLIVCWSFWDENEDYYLNVLAPSIVRSDGSELLMENEKEIVAELRRMLSDVEWAQLPVLIARRRSLDLRELASDDERKQRERKQQQQESMRLERERRLEEEGRIRQEEEREKQVRQREREEQDKRRRAEEVRHEQNKALERRRCLSESRDEAQVRHRSTRSGGSLRGQTGTAERQELLQSIAVTITDYRQGELPRPTPDHVERWVDQFESDDQLPLLREMGWVLKRLYFSRKRITDWLGVLVTNDEFVGKRPSDFWKAATLLSIQQHGNSQKEMRMLLGACLRDRLDLDMESCGSESGPYIYLDDAVFTGARVATDLVRWVREDAPSKAEVHILSVVTHKLAEYQVDKQLKEIAKKEGKNISFHLWRAASLENRKYFRDTSETLWPAVLPDDPLVSAYLAEKQRYPFEPREAGGELEHDIFSSEKGRQLLERVLLLAGVRIRSWCQNPKPVLRPLGFSAFGLGFGSMIATFRNCPNTCPLALWWGDPNAQGPLGNWYPLLRRKTYDSTGEADHDGYC